MLFSSVLKNQREQLSKLHNVMIQINASSTFHCELHKIECINMKTDKIAEFTLVIFLISFLYYPDNLLYQPSSEPITLTYAEVFNQENHNLCSTYHSLYDL